MTDPNHMLDTIDLQFHKERIAKLHREIDQMDAAVEEKYHEHHLELFYQRGVRTGQLEKSLEIVQNLTALGVDLEIIAKSSGLTLEDVKKL